MTKKTYTLKHWQVAEIGEILVLEGHIFGRPEFPDGIWVQTSELLSWDAEEAGILFHTLNSTYICPLEHYILNGDTLDLLGDAHMEQMMAKARELRRNHCLTFLAEAGETDVVILNWEGCDCPYLKWAASVCGREVEYAEPASSGTWVSADLVFNSGRQMSVAVPAGHNTHIALPGPGFEGLPVYIENTGDRPVVCMVNGRMPVSVAPGAFAMAGY